MRLSCSLPLFLSCFLSCLLPSTLHAESSAVQSPNMLHTITFDLDGESLVYSVSYGQRQIIAPSRLGFVLEDGTPFLTNPYIEYRSAESVDRSWKPVGGERNEIPERYNEVFLIIQGDNNVQMNLIFRAYDEGVAFCYEFAKPLDSGKPLVFQREATEFAFAGDYPAWATYSAQGAYVKKAISEIKPGCQRPLVVAYPKIEGVDSTDATGDMDALHVVIGEARLVDYARMLLAPSPDRPDTLIAQLPEKIEIEPSAEKPFRTPWRYIAVANRLGTLLEQNYLALNLNDPCAIADTSWIKPGKVIRETTLSTAGGKACVDFAVDRGLQYIEFDAGWYGHEYDDASDARAVNLDPKRSKGPLDLKEVIAYADAKGIGVLVYVNRRALEKQLDELLPLYKKWGIKGIKFGFVNVGPRKWTRWLHESIQKCADYQLMVDVHDEHRDTGWCRTYPNLMTVEGIRGNEEMPPPEQNIISSLTRMLAGRADYTPCWYTDRVKTSRAHQLALPVVFFGPWTFLYWYDRPAQYQGEPELDLWKELPTVWDDTKVLIDDIPNTVAIARRSGETWYIGILNAGEERSVEIVPDLPLPGGKHYAVTRFTDAGAEGKKITIEETDYASGTSQSFKLRVNGGAVLKIAPKK